MPAPREIPIRKPRFAIEEAPTDWFGGNVFASHVFDALSSTFPDGEAFFVKSVQRFRGEIDDPALAEAVRSFSGQEAQHRHQHDQHVALLVERGYPALETRNRVMRAANAFFVRRLPRTALASTAAVEHLTALLARRLLREEGAFCRDMHPRMVELWQWHALEESEHKAVAFEVLEQVAPAYPRRAFALIGNSIGLAFEVLDRTVYMLWKDGLLFRRDVWRDGLRFLFGADGLFRGLGPDYRAWYRRDFHPDQIDDSALLAEWREKIAA
ncbi:MAG: metal-dependent hydrolase [Myxococcota bacterium]